MNISLAVERHRKSLLRIVATLFAMIGLVENANVERVPPFIYRAVLRLLRPAESAARRLIVAASRGLVLKPPRPRATPRRQVRPGVSAGTARRRSTAFRLFDPRRRFSSAFAGERVRHRIRLVRRPEPRIRVLDVGFDPRVPLFRNPPAVAEAALPSPPPPVDGSVNAGRLCRRLMAIKSALEDLPRQARRYLRWQSRPETERRPAFSSALRPGTPPGHRKNPVHKVDEILAECHWLARDARLSDTS